MLGLSAALFLFTASPESENLVGKTVPPYPPGMESTYGSCMSSRPDERKFCDYSVSEIHRVGEDPHAILLKRFIRYEGDIPVWTVVDQIDWPEQPENTDLFWGVCYRNGEFDPAILAIVEIIDEELVSALGWARKIDFESEKFVVISHEGITCQNLEG